jgi:hypothetical protein
MAICMSRWLRSAQSAAGTLIAVSRCYQSLAKVVATTSTVRGCWRLSMRGFASYLLAGILVVLAMDFVAPPAGLGLAVRASPVTELTATPQFVDRTHKGDRLSLPASVGEQQTLEPSSGIMIGCDPPFSRLLASARANVSGRCVAEMAHPLAG